MNYNAQITYRNETEHAYRLTVTQNFSKGSSYFAPRGKTAPCYFAIWRQNSPKRYFAASAKLALILTLIPTLTQTEEKHYFASEGKIATSFSKLVIQSHSDNIVSSCYWH